MTIDDHVTLSQLKEAERVYASLYWQDMSQFAELTHLILHNQKMLGLLGNVCEVGQHAEAKTMQMPKLTEHLKRRIVANYLIWAVHYADKWGLSLADCFVSKHLDNLRRARNEEKYGKHT